MRGSAAPSGWRLIPGTLIQKPRCLGPGFPPARCLPTGFDGRALAPETSPYQKPDLATARRLLAEAGHPWWLSPPPIRPLAAVSRVCRFLPRPAGRRARDRRHGERAAETEPGAFLKVGLNFDLAATAWTFRADPDGYLYPFFHSTGVLNAGPYRNPHLDALLDQARTTANHAERIDLYDQAQRTLLADAVTYWS